MQNTFSEDYVVQTGNYLSSFLYNSNTLGLDDVSCEVPANSEYYSLQAIAALRSYWQSAEGPLYTSNPYQYGYASNDGPLNHEAGGIMHFNASNGECHDKAELASSYPTHFQESLQIQQRNFDMTQQAQLALEQQREAKSMSTMGTSSANNEFDLSRAQYCIPTNFIPSSVTNNLVQRSSHHNGLDTLQKGIELNEATDANGSDHFESLINRLPAFQLTDQSNQSRAFSPVLETLDFFPLATLPDDKTWLTPLHCFVRQHCVELFIATPADVATPCMGKRSPVSVGQVGIRCPYCTPKNGAHPDRGDEVFCTRDNGVVYPSIVSRIYNATINLLQRHLRTCASVPPWVLAEYDELKSSKCRSGASKKYWVDSALRMGLYDTPNGIRLNEKVYWQWKINHRRELSSPKSPRVDSTGNVSASASPNQHSTDVSAHASPLVLPNDKRYTTAFTFHLMAQVQPCSFTEADRLGRRRGLIVGFPGLACRYCYGGNGNGRFFPSSLKTMSDASKTLDAIYKHICVCKKCPNEVKFGLNDLKEFHQSERNNMPFGNQRAFFAKIWGRLHLNATSHDLPLTVDDIFAKASWKSADDVNLTAKLMAPKLYEASFFNKNDLLLNKLMNEAA